MGEVRNYAHTVAKNAREPSPEWQPHYKLPLSHEYVKSTVKKVLETRRRDCILSKASKGSQQCSAFIGNTDGLANQLLLAKGIPRRTAILLTQLQCGVSKFMCYDGNRVGPCRRCAVLHPTPYPPDYHEVQTGPGAPCDSTHHFLFECKGTEEARQAAGTHKFTNAKDLFKNKEVAAKFIEEIALHGRMRIE